MVFDAAGAVGLFILQSKDQRILALDGLRGIAALSVVLQHFATQAPWHERTFIWSGMVGVQLFFVLSGFLMGRIYSTAPLSRSAVADFWVRRAARVLPLFLICVTIGYAYLWLTGHNMPFYGLQWQGWWMHYVFWDGQSVFWTIPREVQFYLIFPLIWWLCQRLGNAANFLLLGAIAVLQTDGIMYPVFMQAAPLFIAGVIAGRMNLEADKSYDVPFVALLVLFVLSWPGLIDVTGLPKSLYGNISQGTLYLIYLPALVLVSTASPLAQRMLGRGVLKRYGDMSYSVYLLHLPIFSALMLWTPLPHLPRAVFFGLMLGLVTLVSHYSFRYLETPLRRWITSLPDRPKRALALPAAA